MGAPTADVSWVYHPEAVSKAKTAHRPMAVSPEEVMPVALVLVVLALAMYVLFSHQWFLTHKNR